MSEVYTLRIPAELKKRMATLGVEWGEEIRAFIEARVRQLELLRLLEEMEARAAKRRTRIDSTQLIREDRER